MTDLRVEMVEHLVLILEDPTNKGNVFFSDESNFYVSGMINKHNCRISVPKNPFMIVEEATNSPKINIWCVMSGKRIIGP